MAAVISQAGEAPGAAAATPSHPYSYSLPPLPPQGQLQNTGGVVGDGWHLRGGGARKCESRRGDGWDGISDANLGPNHPL